MPRKPKPPKKDKDTQTWIFGRRVDKPLTRAKAARESQTRTRAVMRAFDSLIEQRNRCFPNSDHWKKADAALERFCNTHGLDKP